MADTHSLPSSSHAMAAGYSFSHHPAQVIPPPQQQTVSRGTTRMRGGTGGEIVAVQGGHIVRSTGRKDRHSKVCTAKGPRDRRVRLSAHTAIQFYDVQDRLGYDRPSKAVDWLIKNAKDAIDKLAELPAWTPSATPPNATAVTISPNENQLMTTGVVTPSFDFGGGGTAGGSNTGGGGFLPPSLDSDAIADTIKSFFPLGAASTSGANQSQSPAQAQTIGFQTSYTHQEEPLQQRAATQDLRLSLQSFQDSMYHTTHQHHHGATFAGSGTNLGYGSSSGSALWPEPNRIMQWSMADGASGSGGGGGGAYAFSMPQQAMPMQVLGQSQLYLQRGPLQSSNNSPSNRAWAEPGSSETVDDHQMHHPHPGMYHAVQSIAGFRSASGSGFAGFRIPARIHGEEEEQHGGGLADRPPSAPRH